MKVFYLGSMAVKDENEHFIIECGVGRGVAKLELPVVTTASYEREKLAGDADALGSGLSKSLLLSILLGMETKDVEAVIRDLAYMSESKDGDDEFVTAASDVLNSIVSGASVLVEGDSYPYFEQKIEGHSSCSSSDDNGGVL